MDMMGEGVPQLVWAHSVITDAWCRAVCADVWPERKDGTLPWQAWQVNLSNNIVGAWMDWDKCMSYSSSALVNYGITQLRVSDICLLRDNYLLCFISFFFSSIDIVLMLAHVFSAFVELGYVNHDFFFFFFLMR